jgi:hypothetical protein
MTVRTLGIALGLVLCGGSLYAADTKNIDRTLPLSASGVVELDAHNGSIEVRTWDRQEVEIHVRIEAGGTSDEARRRMQATTVDIEGSSNLVSIRWRQSDLWGWSLWSAFWGEWNTSPDVRYTITAPRTARLRIRDHNARLAIRDVTAPLDVATHNGSVWVANFDGPLDLSMHNGNAHVEFASFTHASRVDSHNGSAELLLPVASRFQIHSIGHRMNVDSDFPVTMRASDFGRHHVDGQANGGGPELRLTSHNGSFRIRSK